LNEEKTEDADANRHRRDEDEPLERVNQHRVTWWPPPSESRTVLRVPFFDLEHVPV
jgi:hypothetical protein